MLNKFMAIGNLTRDPEAKTTNTGKTVCVFTVAVNLGKNDKDPLFIDVQTWDNVAKNCDKFLSKGRKVFVEGRIAINSWTSKSGEKKSKPYCKGDIVTFLSGDKQNNNEAKNKDLTEEDEELANIPF